MNSPLATTLRGRAYRLVRGLGVSSFSVYMWVHRNLPAGYS